MHGEHRGVVSSPARSSAEMPGAERADRAGVLAAQGPGLGEQLHGRGLAVGAGHADHGQRALDGAS